MKLPFRTAVLALAPFLTSSVQAQRATVFYYHVPGSSSTRIEHQLATDPVGTRRAGIPKLLQVPEDGEVCIVVENANPLLYNYAIRQQPIKVETPSQVADMAKVLSGVLSGPSTPPRGEDAALASINVFGDTVGALVQRTTSLQTARLESDAEADFSLSITKAASLLAEARTFNSAADKIYNNIQSLKDHPAVRVLRAEQIRSWTEAQALYAQYESAKGKLGTPLCESVGSERRRIRLSVGVAAEGPKDPRRSVGDSVIAFSVDPRSARAIEVGAGGIMSVFAQDRRRFSIENGVVVGRFDHEPQFRPAVFLLARAWDQRWLWGTLGASADDHGLSNLFLGLSGRFGEEVVGTRLTIGAGLAVDRIVVGLKSGAEEGKALPADAGDLDKVLDRQLRPGLGIVFMLSGM